MSSSSGRERDRENDSYVRLKSRMKHNPPDDINFERFPFDGDERQVCNFAETLLTELKAQGIDTIIYFQDYPEQERPRDAYRRVDRGEDTHRDRTRIKDYEEQFRKNNLLIAKGRSIVQLLTTSAIFSDFSREVQRQKGLDAPVLTPREIFHDVIMNFFHKKYLTDAKLSRVMTKIAKEIIAIPFITSIHGVKGLVAALYSKEENCIRIAWWNDNDDYYLNEKDLKATLFSKLVGEKLQYFISMLNHYAFSGVPRSFHDIADELKEMVSHCDLDSIDNKAAYEMTSDTQVTHTNTHLINFTTHEQTIEMQNQFDFNAHARGQTCFNCDSPSHFLPQCLASKCYICRSVWPTTSSIDYHHPFNCPSTKGRDSQEYTQRQKQRSLHNLRSGPSNQQYVPGSPSQTSFNPTPVIPTLPQFHYVPRNQQQSRGAPSSAYGGGRGSSSESGRGSGRGFGGRNYSNNVQNQPVSGDELRRQFEIQHAANHAAEIAKVNAAFNLNDGMFQIEEEVEYESEGGINQVRGYHGS